MKERKLNLIEPNIAKLRQKRSWTQKELAAKLQLLGCNITSQILANVETHRWTLTDAQIVLFLEAFHIPVKK
jgi:hypothetical protein